MNTKSSMNQILSHLDEMHEDFEKKKKKTMKEYLKNVLNLTKEYIIEHHVVLYGGTAMNLYLEEKSQFYTADDIPDFDGYVLNAQNKALTFAKYLKQKNYNYVLLKKAMHPNTFKLSWDFNDIADFTHVDDTDYQMLVDRSTRIDGFLVSPLSLVKSNAYIELCMPFSSMFRWNKIYTRINLLENQTKSSISKNKLDFVPTNNNQLNDIINQIVKLIIEKKLPFIGIKAIRYYLGCDIWKHETIGKFAYVGCMIEHDSDFCNQVNELLSIQEIQYYSTTKKATSFTLEKTTYHVKIQNKRFKLLSIQKTQSQCFSYILVKQKATEFFVISIFYLLSVLYFHQYLHLKNTNTKLNKQNQVMINKLQKLTKQKHMFTDTCLGSNASKQSIIKKRLKIGENPIIFSHIQ